MAQTTRGTVEALKTGVAWSLNDRGRELRGDGSLVEHDVDGRSRFTKHQRGFGHQSSPYQNKLAQYITGITKHDMP